MLIKALGLGMAIAVALDATVVRALLVPATMRLLGRWNWWLPVRLERLMARLPAGTRAGGRRAARRHPGRWTRWAALGLTALMLAGCSGGPILANPPADHTAPSPTPAASAHASDPQPLVFPRDDGPHDRLTEWWYYTGHLVSDAGRRFGFEYVVFRAERGAFPVSWASHLALTDEQGRRFLYGQRSEIGPQVDASPHGADGSPTGFNLALTGSDPSRGTAATGDPWTMGGGGGRDRLAAALSPADVASTSQPGLFGLTLDLSTDAAPVLHDTIGWIDFGPAGGSYYYSRPRMAAAGPSSSTIRRSP